MAGFDWLDFSHVHSWDTLKKQIDTPVIPRKIRIPWMIAIFTRRGWRETELRVLERQNSSWFRYILYIIFTYDIHFYTECAKMCGIYHVLFCMTYTHRPRCTHMPSAVYRRSICHVSHIWYTNSLIWECSMESQYYFFVVCVLSLVLLLYTRFSLI